MAAQTDTPQLLFAKKVLGMALFILGLLLSATGFYYSSTPMTFIGVIALLVGAYLIVRKIIVRNTDR